jgi:LmbE family N-acetylglucosaminyl deacetylase
VPHALPPEARPRRLAAPAGAAAGARGPGPALSGGEGVDELLRRSSILVIMPHADDETLACGGTMARAKDLGASVRVMIMSAGDLRQYRCPPAQLSSETAPAVHQLEISEQQRVEELEAAMRCLGVDDHTVVYRDSERHLRLDALPRRELIAQIERESALAIDKVRPDMVILPAPSYNQDHQATFEAGFAACRPHLASEKPFAPVVLAADCPQLGWAPQPLHLSVYVDISDYLERKLEAHACHRSQLRPEPHHASLENIARLARVRGSEVAVRAAEAFVCYRLRV